MWQLLAVAGELPALEFQPEDTITPVLYIHGDETGFPDALDCLRRESACLVKCSHLVGGARSHGDFHVVIFKKRTGTGTFLRREAGGLQAGQQYEKDAQHG